MMPISKAQKDNKLTGADLAALLVLLATAVLVNRDLHTSWLYIDDLFMWYSYKTQGIREFIFPSYTTHFRPVFWLLQWAELSLIGSHMEYVIPINLGILVLTAWILYRMIFRVSGSRAVSLAGAMSFTASRFSCYSVSQLIGIIESVSLLLSLLCAAALYRYLRGGRRICFAGALLCYVLACFTHERYIVLLPMFLYAAAVRCAGEKRLPAALTDAAAALLVFAGILAVRYHFLGTLAPAGTGGTIVTQTFTLKEGLKNVGAQLVYLFGFNAGPIHLCGMTWQQTPLWIKAVSVLADGCILYLCIRYVQALVRDPEKTGRIRSLTELVFWLGFIIGCVTASSVTIRLEMRWIHVSFAFCCLLLGHMTGCAGTRDPQRAVIYRGAAAAAFLLLLVSNVAYRAGFPDLYLFEEQARRESLVDVTYGSYGDDIFDMDIYVIGNFYQVTPFEEEYLLKPSEAVPDEDELHIIHVVTPEEVPAGEKVLILYEDPIDDTYKVYEPAAAG